MLEILKAILFGIVEGITEWLPVSSTGHLILLDEFVKLQVSEEFSSMFDVVIQLGAILAVILLFFKKLNPLDKHKSEKQRFKTWRLWFMVIIAIIPSGLLGVLLDDWLDAHLYNAIVVGAALIILAGATFIGMRVESFGYIYGSNLELGNDAAFTAGNQAIWTIVIFVVTWIISVISAFLPTGKKA